MENKNKEKEESKYLKGVLCKISKLKENYRDMCKSLSEDFSREADSKIPNVHVASSSYLRDLPLVAKEIYLLEAVVRDLQSGDLKADY